MDVKQDNYKIITATVIGAIGGVILGRYIWGSKGSSNRNLSKHLATLSKVLEEIEGINTEESENLKERIQSILTIIESGYDKHKE